MTIAGIILTNNEAAHIEDCISSIQWADHVVVFDSYSTDDTVALAKATGATVIQNPFENFAQQRNDALRQIDADWVLFVDADERIPTTLAEEIRETIATTTHVYDGYFLPRHNYIFGRLTRHTGWYPDYQMRLLRHGRAWYAPEVHVHEVVILADDSEPGYLNEPIIHYNYSDIRHFIRKQRYYARFDAKIWFQQGVQPVFRNYILQPLREFRRRFFELRGYKDGLHGLLLSLLMAWNEFDKYWQLRSLWRQHNMDQSLEKPN
jgi:(heptosyl)LPS beta-1,4-glucosyltransferase